MIEKRKEKTCVRVYEMYACEKDRQREEESEIKEKRETERKRKGRSERKGERTITELEERRKEQQNNAFNYLYVIARSCVSICE